MSAVFKDAAATIASGASLSGAIHCGQSVPVQILMPASWTAAVITFQTSLDGVTYKDLFSSGDSEITATVAASRAVTLEGADFAGSRYIKLRSGTTGTPVNQGADRVFTVICRKEPR